VVVYLEIEIEDTYYADERTVEFDVDYDDGKKIM